jgi:polyhydroxybutyrate depolymerase
LEDVDVFRTPALMHASRLGFLPLAVVLVAGCGSGQQPIAPSTSASGGGSVQPGSSGNPPSEDAGAPLEDATTGSPPIVPPSGDAGVGSAPPSASCTGTQTWTPGTSTTITLDYGDAGARSYDVYVGTSVQSGTAVPLVVNMHGLLNSPAIQAQFSQMNPVADTNGFVVVYPAGLNASFNAGSCCGASAAAGVDDVGFVRAVVADAESKICINPKRVYETGFSNGGMMSYQLACNAADLFAAVAPTEGENETNTPCNPSRPVPLAAFEYLGDPVVLPAAAQQSVVSWATQDGCTDATPTQTTNAAFACEEWSHCNAGSLVWYCTLPGGTHYPPAGSAPVIWSFLSQFTLP